MKKLLIIVLFSTFSSTFGQEYKPLLDNYNEWHVTTCFFGCLTDKYFTAGDTIVGANDYKVLDGYHYISRTFLLREELLDRKVYMNIVSPSGNNEYLLYDFSMIVGDSIDMKNPITPFPENAGYYRLDSIIPRPLADGDDYRHFYLSPALSNTISNTNAIWVEGAGSLSLINAPSGDPDINGAGSLSCSFKNSIPFYRNLDSIDSCEPLIVLGLNEFSNQLYEVQVNTLVTDKYCHLTNVQNARFIDVYDLHGRRLIDHSNNGKREISLDFSNLKSGVYIIVMNTNQFQKRTFKVIVK
jgi:hypothetical protein|tara:strand:- start:896 stop:1789 length:894 start_codon:yes stop_codon:yes gene_type:complete